MTAQEPINRDDIEKAPEEPFKSAYSTSSEDDCDYLGWRDHGRDEDSLFNSDLADHLNELVDLPGRKSSEAFITAPMLNYSDPWQTRGDLHFLYSVLAISYLS